MSEKTWKEHDDDCPICGANPVEIFTECAPGYGYEGDEMRCTECGAKGSLEESMFGNFIMVVDETTEGGNNDKA